MDPAFLFDVDSLASNANCQAAIFQHTVTWTVHEQVPALCSWGLLLMLITSILLVRPMASAVSLQRRISRTGAGTWSIMCMYGAVLMHNLRSTQSLGPVFRNREPLMALDLTCDSGGSYLYPDEYTCWLEDCMQANPTVPLTAAGMP
jgi:hypothetical protein